MIGEPTFVFICLGNVSHFYYIYIKTVCVYAETYYSKKMNFYLQIKIQNNETQLLDINSLLKILKV
jgi:hypothetical protein